MSIDIPENILKRILLSASEGKDDTAHTWVKLTIQAPQINNQPSKIGLKQISPAWPIKVLDFSARTHNCLEKAGITALGHLDLSSEEELLLLRNFGERSLQEVKDKMAKFGLRLLTKEDVDRFNEKTARLKKILSPLREESEDEESCDLTDFDPDEEDLEPDETVDEGEILEPDEAVEEEDLLEKG
jgi:hypothetical protein